MYYETDFLLLLPYMRILVHALYFLSLHSDPLTLLPSCLTPAPRARKLRYHQLIAGWSSACKALDESESWSVLWKAVCCQIVLNSGTCPHPISSPRFEDIPPPPPSFPFCMVEIQGHFVAAFFLAPKVLNHEGLCLAPLLSLAMLQYWWGRKAA